MFEPIPAIDILGGQVVRLTQGDYTRAKVYASDPAVVARQWAAAGAQFLHLVDLDGARSGRPVNLAAIKKLRQNVNCRLELGGGLRTAADVAQVFALGIDYAILGSAALQNKPLTQELVQKYGARIIIGVDARDGRAAASGWLEDSEVDALDLIKELEKIGVQKIIYTEINRDGTLSGPDLALYRKLLDSTRMEIIASGGVASLADVQALSALRLDGVIIGKALYEGKINIRDLYTPSI
ncbi:MAG: 1-(5-phosphoribosyl)-5-[(5-phosphoribosylamino)methylideneamino]imidazole-4-carboxamide isomerase [Candidatus Margulisbacteria bacterium]|jgi:phosphoribosylformimino-5-aminoimidazole carboxamide ribotide isomerase|nr:1-(5-phosphoribosyl)-5-[(5-phosphoribosylamino)methylideneamino]imidazole-4-carboxamide isomerase [Candidatus Margulisiibacteriota bacterium]